MREREFPQSPHCAVHSVENEKFSLTEKKFRQIIHIVIYLVKPLHSRNFCKKSVRKNFCNFSRKNFVKATVSAK